MMSLKTNLVPVILAGGSGTRLWPLSRSLFPKQFLALNNTNTLLQETLSRLEGLDGVVAPLIICNEHHRFIVAEQLRQSNIVGADILLEPCGRNTAPAIAAAALHAMRDGADPLLLVLAADHVILDTATFHKALALAVTTASEGSLVTFGIQPRSPEIGYGYIHARKAARQPAWAIDCFVEKPDLQTAQRYLDSGEYFWNSGMFMFRASVYLGELEKFAPEILRNCRNAHASAVKDLDFVRLDATAFALAPEDSVDYAVMEKTDKAMMIPLDAGWSDIGSWTALWEIADKDADGNVIRGDVIGLGNTDCYISSTDNRLVAAVGLKDMIVVDTSDAVLVAQKDQVHQVKALVDILKQQHRSEYQQHRTVYRPWGSYTGIDMGERYQVKRIVVLPGEKLSLQMHHHRAEHWIVVSGTAQVTRGEEEVLLSENQSIYIPLGTCHSLHNPGKIRLELIEVQTGSYLGEDDIIRIKDKYGRN